MTGAGAGAAADAWHNVPRTSTAEPGSAVATPKFGAAEEKFKNHVWQINFFTEDQYEASVLRCEPDHQIRVSFPGKRIYSLTREALINQCSLT